MEKLNFQDLDVITGGDFGDAVDGFCIGYGVVAGGYAIGVAANWWNPVGWIGTAIGGIVAVGCGINALT
ncbi:hypothetical protein [Kordia sp.]|uniref:hypothetical protein n=1 Tax=Kordia sp. TaxID=1965332 RepID=UPI0025BDB218|nr:hypothetical protein [Kordia sp.]MCH2197054.1 hypothetical protein [Kordia sp.]